MVNSRISERDLILPSLFIIEKNPGISTTKLKEKLVDFFKPTGEDAEILANRSDTKFTQIVRNLVAHHTLDQKNNYVIYERKGSNGYHTITLEGKGILDRNKEAVEYLFYGDFVYKDIAKGINNVTNRTNNNNKVLVYDEHLEITEGKKKTSNNAQYERSKKLRDIAVEHFKENGEIYCRICGFNFKIKYGEIGDDFIEIHHIRPIFAYEDKDELTQINKALENLIPVCSNCHRMLHHKKKAILTINELIAIVNRID